MTGRRLALVVASQAYEHESLRQLRSPAADATALAEVLRDPEVAGFEVRVLHDEPSYQVAAAIEDLFSDARPDDLLLLHFSGHGLKDESSQLFFAARNTRPDRLGSSAVAAEFVQRCMRSSRARRMVLFLDCCYGGAFAQGVSVRASGSANVLEAFPADRLGGGRGRAVISASSAMEYAFEGTELAQGQATPSVFTTALVHGLRTGEADRDEDGLVSLNELYDYVFDKVREQNPNQTPTRDVEMQGEVYLARSGRKKVLPAALPPELAAALADQNMFARLGAVGELGTRLRSSDPAVALGARIALKGLAANDISYVATAASAALSSLGSPAPPELSERERVMAPPGFDNSQRQPAAPAELSEREPVMAPPGFDKSQGVKPLPSGQRVAGWLAASGGTAQLLAMTLPFASGELILNLPGGVPVGAVLFVTGALAVTAGVAVLTGRGSPAAELGLLAGAAVTATVTAALLSEVVVVAGSSVSAGFTLSALAVLVLLAAGVATIVAARQQGCSVLGPGRGASSLLLAATLAVTGAMLLTVQGSSGGLLATPEWWAAVVTLLAPVLAVLVRPVAFGAAMLGAFAVGGLSFAPAALPSGDAGAGDWARVVGITAVMVALGLLALRHAGPAAGDGRPVMRAVGGAAALGGVLLGLAMTRPFQYGDYFPTQATDLLVAFPLLSGLSLVAGVLLLRRPAGSAGAGTVLSCGAAALWALSTLLGRAVKDGGYDEPGWEMAVAAALVLLLGAGCALVVLVRTRRLGRQRFDRRSVAGWLLLSFAALGAAAMLVEAVAVVPDNAWWQGEAVYVGALTVTMALLGVTLRDRALAVALLTSWLALGIGVGIKDLAVLADQSLPTTAADAFVLLLLATGVTLLVSRGRFGRGQPAGSDVEPHGA
ncbi:MAG TPA: caspase family protein [Dermatophilaceae bacterium]|nr:caspase family protein [Dermatophilaceae bacterium]